MFPISSKDAIEFLMKGYLKSLNGLQAGAILEKAE